MRAAQNWVESLAQVDGCHAADTLPPEAAVSWQVGFREGRERGVAEGWSAGHAEGYSVGIEEGLAKARIDFACLADAIQRRVEVVGAEFAEVARLVDERTVDLAIEIAGAILQREITVAENPGAEAVRRALAFLPDDIGTDVVMRLSPDDHLRFDDPENLLIPGRTLRVVADPALAAGDCVLDAGATRIDAGIDSALRRVQALLTEGVGAC